MIGGGWGVDEMDVVVDALDEGVDGMDRMD